MTNRERGSLSLRQLMVSAAVAAALLIVAVAVVPGVRAQGKAPNHYVISETDYRFTPARLTLKAGQTVTITLINNSQGHPGHDHEFMIGRVPNKEASVFGQVQGDGFKTDFFAGVPVQISNVKGLKMLMPGMAKLDQTGMMLMKQTMGSMGMGAMEGGFMPVLAPGGEVTLTFTVPNKPGQWEIGCFQGDGQHFLNGMRGLITVVGNG